VREFIRCPFCTDVTSELVNGGLLEEISSAERDYAVRSAVKHETEPDTGSCVFSVRNQQKVKVHES